MLTLKPDSQSEKQEIMVNQSKLNLKKSSSICNCQQPIKAGANRHQPNRNQDISNDQIIAQNQALNKKWYKIQLTIKFPTV